jgi:hypothetical protein
VEGRKVKGILDLPDPGLGWKLSDFTDMSRYPLLRE